MLPRYSEYKESSIEWMGNVPAHWLIVPIRRVAMLESGHTPSRSVAAYWENCTVPWFTLADIWQVRKEARAVVYETAERISELGIANSSARKLPPGTVLLSRTASVGFPLILGLEMATSQDFAAWICGDRLANRYLYLCLIAMRAELGRLMMGSTHQTIYMPDIEKLRCPLPPILEQISIVSFLDRETAKIDALVAEQEKLIELLKEKRQAVISHAVTKGLDPKVPMKDSGIGWLGEVPKHWMVLKLKHCADLRSGETINSDSIDETGPFPVYGGNGLRGYTDAYTHEGFFPLIGRQGALCGNINYANGKFWASEHAIVVTADGSVAPNWLGEALRAMNLNQYSVSAAQPGLSVDAISNLFLGVPPIAEQREISEFLEVERLKALELMNEAERAITLLKERRAALISAAVTGKIDVRGLADVEAA